METMPFSHSQYQICFEDNVVSHSGVPMNNLAPMGNCPGCMVSLIGCRGRYTGAWGGKPSYHHEIV